MNIREEMQKATKMCGINLSEKQYGKFVRYYDLLIEGNKQFNLTALTEPRDVAIKHFMDSLSIYDEEIFGNAANVVDIGSGAGFPGIPLKIYDEKMCMTLLDSLGKRTNFLEKVVDELQLSNVKCVKARAEDAARDEKMREKFTIAVSRAVAPLNILVEYVLPFVKIGGKMIAMKGKKAEDEIQEATHAIEIMGGGNIKIRKIKLPMIDDVRYIVTITKIKETTNTYPRRAGLPQKKPLL